MLLLLVTRLCLIAIKLNRHTGKDAGQIGRTADLHNSIVRRVRYRYVLNAPIVSGRELVG